MTAAGLELFSHHGQAGAPPRPGDILRALDYCEVAPATHDRPVVVCVWTTRVPHGRLHALRVVPDGCADVVFGAPEGPQVFGPRSAWHELELPAGSQFAGVRLRPEALGAVLSVDAGEIAGRVEPLVAVRPAARTPSITGFLAFARERAPDLDPLVAEAVEAITRQPRPRVSELASRLGVSERTLSRRFGQAVGLAPASYRRVARFRRLLLLPGDDAGWARRAAQLGYADQAHLVREFRAMTGTTPATLAG